MSDEDQFTAEGSYGEFSFRTRSHVLRHLVGTAATVMLASKAVAALGCVRLRVCPDWIEVAATDMDRTVVAVSQAVYCGDVYEAGYAEAFIPARKLTAVLKELPDADVTVEVKGNRAVVGCGSTWTLALPDASDYPELLDAGALGWHSYPREEFLAALRSVRHAVCRNGSMPAYAQVEVKNHDGHAAVTAADSIRFARARIASFPADMCIPSSVLDNLIRLLAAGKAEDIGVAATDDHLAFRVGPVTLAVARRSTGFPDTDQLLLKPTEGYDQELRVDRDDLLGAVRRVRVNADESTSAVALVVSGETLTVAASDKFANSASEIVAAGWGSPKDRALCVNHAALSEMAAAHPDKTCTFRLGPDAGMRRSLVRLQSDTLVQVISQMAQKLAGLQ